MPLWSLRSTEASSSSSVAVPPWSWPGAAAAALASSISMASRIDGSPAMEAKVAATRPAKQPDDRGRERERAEARRVHPSQQVGASWCRLDQWQGTPSRWRPSWNNSCRKLPAWPSASDTGPASKVTSQSTSSAPARSRKPLRGIGSARLLRGDRDRCHLNPPSSWWGRRAPLLPTVGLLAPGSMLPSAFPGRGPVAWSRFAPRSQWRDRVGIAPTSRTRGGRHPTRGPGPSTDGPAGYGRPVPDLGPRLVVAGTQSGVGKTTVATGLLAALRAAGHRPGGGQGGARLHRPRLPRAGLRAAAPEPRPVAVRGRRHRPPGRTGGRRRRRAGGRGGDGAVRRRGRRAPVVHRRRGPPARRARGARGRRRRDVRARSPLSSTGSPPLDPDRPAGRRGPQPGRLRRPRGAAARGARSRSACRCSGRCGATTGSCGATATSASCRWPSSRPPWRRASRRLPRRSPSASTSAPCVALARSRSPACPSTSPAAARHLVADRCAIAVAGGRAFTFTYTDTLDALTAAGAEVVPFDPLHDAPLPDGPRRAGPRRRLPGDPRRRAGHERAARWTQCATP